MNREEYRESMMCATMLTLSRLSDTELREACIIITDMHPEHCTGIVAECLREAGIAHG